ncbi:cupin domain-containing protein [Paraburkholderia caledonica]|uniref:Mannose-6-phosphate isomerase-like protein (Cupin superfamily) n=1 Tax=Paraburkholderia caledonica TaxID=134536 RepID=A0ABU1KYT6_9BURK|nr:cupin domain-containing protein [Paraburkholderia caledonica]MDR6376126.1 mannose-6-phosphate isomerase-like protein (cupin superfamily) [Paraburkholderia caledonica]
MPRHIRTIVTGHNAEGESVIEVDRVSAPGRPEVFNPAHDPNLCLTNVHVFPSVPASPGLNLIDGEVAVPFSLKPPGGGAIFRYLEIPPESIRKYDHIDNYFDKMGASDDLAKGAKRRHPAMHKTKTIDVLVVLEGEIWLILDKEEVLCRQGDFIVQHATNHAWSNRTDRPCSLALILVDAV